MSVPGGSHLGKPHSHSKYAAFAAVGQSSLEPIAWPLSVVPQLCIRIDTLAFGIKSVTKLKFCNTNGSRGSQEAYTTVGLVTWL